MAIKIFSFPEEESTDLFVNLVNNWPDAEWAQVDSPDSADVVFLKQGLEREVDLTEFELKMAILKNGAVVSYTEVKNAHFALSQLMSAGSLTLPLPESAFELERAITARSAAYEKLKSKNSKHLSQESRADEDLIDDKISIEAHALHHAALERALPEVKNILDSRFRNAYSRKIEGYLPLIARNPDSAYSHHLAKTDLEHLDRLSRAAKSFADLGIDVSPVNLGYSQVAHGLPFLGGWNRKQKGLKAPDSAFVEESVKTARLHLEGVAYALADLGEAAFEAYSPRVGVKPYSFQGFGTMSTSHLVRQTAWKIMSGSDKGLFHFADHSFPTLVGQRRSDSGVKRRRAFVMGEDGEVAATRVLDGNDLVNSMGVQQAQYADGSEIFAARIRHVDNPSSLQNDVTTVVPALIGDFKTKFYKHIFQQDLEIMNSHLPGTTQFEEFWKEGWETMDWMKERAKANFGITTFEGLMEWAVKTKQSVYAGDVANFDGNTTWEVAAASLEPMVSPEMLQVIDNIWNADTLGNYCSKSGENVYYRIDKSDPFTKLMMDHTPSGVGVTSQVGRGVVPTVLKLAIRKGFDIPEAIFDKGAAWGKRFAFLSAVLNNAGDDHAIFCLIISLVTGLPVLEVRETLDKTLQNIGYLEIAREVPAMEAGYYFHEDKEGYLTAISLSEKRLVGNTCFPEHARSALGLQASLLQYIEAAAGSPFEDSTTAIAEIVLKDVYKFESWDALQLAVDEDLAYIEEVDNSGATAKEIIAAQLGIKASLLDYMYSYDELLDLGIEEELLDDFRQPIPQELTVNPFRFLNKDTLTNLAMELK